MTLSAGLYVCVLGDKRLHLCLCVLVQWEGESVLSVRACVCESMCVWERVRVHVSVCRGCGGCDWWPCTHSASHTHTPANTLRFGWVQMCCSPLQPALGTHHCYYLFSPALGERQALNAECPHGCPVKRHCIDQHIWKVVNTAWAHCSFTTTTNTGGHLVFMLIIAVLLSPWCKDNSLPVRCTRPVVMKWGLFSYDVLL